MCVAVAPARFARTTVFAGEARRNGRVVHVAGYENSVRSLVRGGSAPRRLLNRLRGAQAPSGNAMILHFPAVPGSMTSANVVDTEACPRILADMVRALSPPVADASPASLPTFSKAQNVEVFEHGIYTVALAVDARAIPDALDQIPTRRRPDLNPALFDWYHATFPGWPVALCCFDTVDAARATPMLWWYEPSYPEWLFAPGIDAHTGEVPDLDADVQVDHWVVLGSDEGIDVRYRDQLPDDVATLLPDRVVGVHLQRRMRNADFVMPAADIRSGTPSVERRLLVTAA